MLGAHPYGAANPPEALYPDTPGSGVCPPQFADQQGACYRNARSFYFRHVEDQRAIMEEHGDGAKQIWLTEFGWSACQGLPVAPGYEYCLLTSEEQQAAYLVRAFQLARARWPWVGVMFVWNLNYAAIPGAPANDEKNGWSALRADGSVRPFFEAVKQLPK